jgi:pimeloyl-ACP methyl ester carboxylesterase
MIFTLWVPALAVAIPEKPYENSCFFKYKDYTLHYRVYDGDPADKKQIMLIHGFCLSTASLEGIAEKYMTAGYDVVTVDAPNFGYSTRETDNMELLDREEIIYALMCSLGGKWIVGGHSMGGGIAINIATDYSESVSGLVLYAPQTNVKAEGLTAKMAKSKLMQTIMEVICAFALRMPFLVRMLVEMSFSDKEFAKSYDLERITAPISVDGTGAGVAIMSSHTRGTDFEKLSTLNIPCVIFTASEDRVASAENLEIIINSAPEGTLVYNFEKGGHMMMEYNPEGVAELSLPVMEMCR